jgi:hypothetical protein
MKKLLGILVLGLFLITPSQANDIRDFQIEGMSIGDSLLDHFSKAEIKAEIEESRYMYERFTKQFGEVYLYKGLETYDYISFLVKTDDEKFIIHLIRGAIAYNDNIDECYKKKDVIVKDFSKNFKYAKKKDRSFKHGIDTTGRSTVNQTKFIFKSGDQLNVQCMDFEEDLRINKNFDDGLDVLVQTKEVFEWLSSPIK